MARKEYLFSRKEHVFLGTLATPSEIDRAEIHYLYPEKRCLQASERARSVRSRLWGVNDGSFVYVRLFPKPVSAVKAFTDFIRGAEYGFEPEGEPLGFLLGTFQTMVPL